MTVARVGLFAGAVLVAVGSATAHTAARQARPAWVLSALPAIGTVYWRAECDASPRWSLGLTAFRSSATDRVIWTAGGRRARRVLQPSGTAWFPFTAAKLQKLAVGQFTEPGLLRATVSANFALPGRGHVVVAHCYPYAPPRVTVQVYPR
jgi:hypothetical protein